MAQARFSHRRSLVAAVAALLLWGCASDGDEASSTADDRPSSTSTTTTDAETPPPPEPVRILAAGDSMMYDTSPGLAEALAIESGTVVEMLVPTLYAPASRPQLGRALDEAPTDVVVLMVGVWETGYETSDGLEIEDPGWADGYRIEVLDPLVELVTDHGSRLVLVHEPPMRSEPATTLIATLSGTWADLAADVPEVVTYAEASEWLGGGPAYVEAVALSDGTQERLRRTDGVHLCREGAVRMVQGIVELVDDLVDPGWEPALVEGWEHGPWTERFPAAECPPVEATP